VALRKTLVDPSAPAPGTNWRRGLPALSDGVVTLREVRSEDAPSLAEHLFHPAVLRYVAPCPDTAAGFRRFIRWARSERRRGTLACYGIVPSGHAVAVGVIQFWPIERDFSTAEWGFVLGEAFWGKGIFGRAAKLTIGAAFSQFGVYRLEARAVDANARGNHALAALGATREGALRGAFHDNGIVRAHVMWSILAPEWRARQGRVPHAV
jgi:RimJ/RimL family protein N-acetyltransferase